MIDRDSPQSWPEPGRRPPADVLDARPKLLRINEAMVEMHAHCPLKDCGALLGVVKCWRQHHPRLPDLWLLQLLPGWQLEHGIARLPQHARRRGPDPNASQAAWRQLQRHRREPGRVPSPALTGPFTLGAGSRSVVFVECATCRRVLAIRREPFADAVGRADSP